MSKKLVKGEQGLRRFLRKLGRETNEPVRRVLKEEAEKMAQEMKNNLLSVTNKRTGSLADAITVASGGNRDGLSLRVGVAPGKGIKAKRMRKKLWYGRVIHEGRKAYTAKGRFSGAQISAMRGNPYAKDAFDSRAPNSAKKVNRVVNKFLRDIARQNY